jgi:hypothetical protein
MTVKWESTSRRVILVKNCERAVLLTLSIMLELFIAANAQYKIENNEMGGAFRAHGGGERCVYSSGWERDHWGNPGVGGRIILGWIFGKWDGGMNWIRLAQDRDRWQRLVNVVMDVCGP